MGDHVVWFSHREERYDAELKGTQRVFNWSRTSEIWDWNNCTVTAVSRPNNRVRVIVRSTNTIQSEYMKRDVQVRYMLGFDVANVDKPKIEPYREPAEHNIKNKAHGPERDRWVIQLDKNYWIWKWAKEGEEIGTSDIQKIYDLVKQKLDRPDFSKSNIFDIETEDDDRIIPVVYQPAIDSWKNFVREIHCHKCGTDQFEVTILFNNEELREHAIVNKIYEWFRSLVYGRKIDVESFRIMLVKEVPQKFEFKSIYSGENEIQEDDIHLDKPDLNGRVPTHDITYYFANTRHPILFVNTSNHAMSEHDTNHRLWKWEYITWERDSPILYGEKSRQQIDRSFKPKLRFW